LTWTYHLRSDVLWHDGAPFTAHDIAFTIDLYTHPDVLIGTPGRRLVTVVNDTTVTISYWSQRARIFGHGFNTYLPRHLLEHLDPTEYGEWDFQTELWPPVGYGPFRYVRHETKTMVELEPNPDWFGVRPKVDRLIIRFGGDPVIEFEAGNVDASATLNPTTAFTLAARPDFDYCLEPLWFPSVIYWNHRHPALSDIRVRQALSLAIDRRELATVRGFPADVALPDVLLTPRQRHSFNPDTRSADWEWPEDVPSPTPRDTARAAALLEEAGWSDEDGDGVREKGNQELRFNLLTDGGGVREAVVLQEQFSRIGAQMEIETIVRSVGLDRFEAGDFDAALSGVGPQAYGGPMFRALAGRPGEDQGRPVGYFNPRFAELVAAGEDWAGSLLEESWLEMQLILRRDVVVTFLLPELRVTVFRQRVRGLLENNCELFRAEELWVEEDGG
jgi:peptide/nickel transport system substrate-binding protein